MCEYVVWIWLCPYVGLFGPAILKIILKRYGSQPAQVFPYGNEGVLEWSSSY